MLKFEDHGAYHKYISNAGILVGTFKYGQITQTWSFELIADAYPYDWSARVNPVGYRRTCAPHVVAFIDEHLALLNIAARLTS